MPDGEPWEKKDHGLLTSGKSRRRESRRDGGIAAPPGARALTDPFGDDIVSVFTDDAHTAHAEAARQRTFPQFKDLPAELRLCIWEAALPGPVVVPRIWNNDKGRYGLRRRVPAVLQACRESRYSLTPDPEEQPRDRRVIKHQVVDIYGKTGAQAGVYVNWATDSVWIQRGYNILQAEMAAYLPLRSLVMNWGLRPCWVETTVAEGVAFVRRFPRLELLTLVIDFSEHAWPDGTPRRAAARHKRREVTRIAARVREAFDEAADADVGGAGPKPRLHVVPRTDYWRCEERR
ncbi:hypothetical protein NKR23_g4353 [Pleurostoma richardsiae]|uniref:2EXR domain-containing protein n=1 Tax=Pleurostoma richardsiae TaxID=41990 RepID=A0AA38RW21_9PEZI|nr:hypothetical protein NKR23_g4353 [Pleurostoma richardsiae]